MDDVPCTYRVSVKAIIRDNDCKILLLNEEGQGWELPGGGLDHGEDPREGLKREIIEETGFTVESISNAPTAFWTINQEGRSPTLKWFAFVGYDVKVSGEFAPTLETEHEKTHLEAKFFTAQEAKALPLHANTQPFVDNL